MPPDSKDVRTFLGRSFSGKVNSVTIVGTASNDTVNANTNIVQPNSYFRGNRVDFNVTTNIITGNGNDRINTNLDGDLHIQSGAGNDTVTADVTSLTPTARIDLGTGNDLLVLDSHYNRDGVLRQSLPLVFGRFELNPVLDLVDGARNIVAGGAPRIEGGAGFDTVQINRITNPSSQEDQPVASFLRINDLEFRRTGAGTELTIRYHFDDERGPDSDYSQREDRIVLNGVERIRYDNKDYNLNDVQDQQQLESRMRRDSAQGRTIF